jgi:hypothetical protein
MLLASSMGAPSSAQDPTVEQLAQIASLLESNDVEALRLYLDANPQLMSGDSEIAILLTQFYAESADVTAFLGFSPRLRDIIGSPNFTDGPSQTSDFAPASGEISSDFAPPSGEIY